MRPTNWLHPVHMRSVLAVANNAWPLHRMRRARWSNLWSWFDLRLRGYALHISFAMALHIADHCFLIQTFVLLLALQPLLQVIICGSSERFLVALFSHSTYIPMVVAQLTRTNSRVGCGRTNQANLCPISFAFVCCGNIVVHLKLSTSCISYDIKQLQFLESKYIQPIS